MSTTVSFSFFSPYSSLCFKYCCSDENITVLTEFLTSGPTNKIALIPYEVRNVCYLLDEELKKTSEKVRNLTQGVKTVVSAANTL